MASLTSAQSKYDLFISYASADDASLLAGKRVPVVHELKRALEEHVHPDVKEKGKGRFRVCTDKEDFEMHGLVQSAIRDRINEAPSLLVICSGASVASKYVSREIVLFKELHPGCDPLTAYWDLLPEQAFPEHFPPGTLGADIAYKTTMTIKTWRAQVRNESHKIAAGVWGVPLARVHDRWRAEMRAARQRTIAALIATVFIILAIVTPFILILQRNATIETAAKGLASGIGQERGTIPEAEWDTIWELACNRDDAVRQRFFEIVLSSPATAKRFNNRADILTHAAIGLEPQRRKRLLDSVVLPALKRKTADSAVHIACARIGFNLHERRPEFATGAAAAIRSSIGDADRRVLSEFLSIFNAIQPSLSDEDKRSTATAFANRVQAILTAPTHNGLGLDDLESLRDVARTVGGHLDSDVVSETAKAFVDRIIDELPHPAAPIRTERLVKVFEEAAKDLTPLTSERIANDLIVAMRKARPNERLPLALILRGFSRVPDGPVREARRVFHILSDDKIPLEDQEVDSLIELFRDLAPKLVHSADEIADDVLAAIPKVFYSKRPALGAAFLLLAGDLNTHKSESIAATFSQYFIFDFERIGLTSVSKTYESVAQRLTDADRDRLVVSLIEKMKSSNYLRDRAWNVLETSVEQIGDREKARLANQLMGSLSSAVDFSESSFPFRLFHMLVKATWDEDYGIADAIEKAIPVVPPPHLAGLAKSIRAVGKRLNEERARALARMIALRALDGEALVVVAPLLDRESAAEVADRITRALNGEDDSRRREGITDIVNFRQLYALDREEGEARRCILLLDALRTLGSNVDGVIAKRAVEPIKTSLTLCKSPGGFDSLISTFSKISAYLERRDILDIAAVAAQRSLLVAANLDEKSAWASGEPPQLGKSIRTLGPLVDSASASATAGQALKALSETNDPEKFACLIEIIRVMARQMDPVAAKEIIEPTAILAATRIITSGDSLRRYSSFKDLVASVDSEVATKVAERNLEAMLSINPGKPKAYFSVHQFGFLQTFGDAAKRLSAKDSESLAKRLQEAAVGAHEELLQLLANAFLALTPQLDAESVMSTKAALLMRSSDFAGAAIPIQLQRLSETFASMADLPDVAASRNWAQAIADRIIELRQTINDDLWQCNLPEISQRLYPRLEGDKAQTLKLTVIELLLRQIGNVGDLSLLDKCCQGIQDATADLSRDKRNEAANLILDALSDPVKATALARWVEERPHGGGGTAAVPLNRLVLLYDALIDPDDLVCIPSASLKAADQMIRAAPDTSIASDAGKIDPSAARKEREIVFTEIFRTMTKAADPAWANRAGLHVVSRIQDLERKLQDVQYPSTDLEVRSNSRINLLVEMLGAFSDQVGSSEAEQLITSLIEHIGESPTSQQVKTRLDLIRKLASRTSASSSGDFATRLIAFIPPYSASASPHIGAILDLVSRTDIHGARLVNNALVKLTMRANRWDDDSLDIASQIIDSMPPVLATQQWIDLLKSPTCLGPMREATLRQVNKGLGRAIPEIWDLAELAHLHGVDLRALPVPP